MTPEGSPTGSRPRVVLLVRELLVDPSSRGTLVVTCYLSFLLVTNDLVTQVIGRGAFTYGVQKDLALLLLLWHGVRARVWRRWNLTAAISIALILVGCALGLDRITTMTAAGYGMRNSYTGLLLLLTLPPLLSPRHVDRLLDIVSGLAVAASGLAVVTWCFGLRWLTLVVDHSAAAPYFLTGSIWPRAFSPFVSPSDLGVVASVAIAMVMVRWQPVLGLPPAAQLIPLTGAVGLSLSRSAMIGTAAAAALMLLPNRSRRFVPEPAREGKERAAAPPAVVVMVLLVVTVFFILRASAVPMLGWTDAGLASSSAHSPGPLTAFFAEPSWRGHVESVSTGVELLAHYPRGLGLGNVGQRARAFVHDGYLVESSVLLVGLETGWVGLLGFGLLGFALVAPSAGRLLRRRATAWDGLLVCVAVALAPTLVFLPLIQEIGAMWTCWLVVAAAAAGGQAIAHPEPG